MAALLASAFMGGLLSLMTYVFFLEPQSMSYQQQDSYAGLIRNASYGGPQALDFTGVAKVVTPTVVHIKTFGQNLNGGAGNMMFDEMFRDFFGEPQQRDNGRDDGRDQENEEQRLSSGSGVIVATDGFVVTNNHVIDGAEKIIVALDNKKEYLAKLVGKDPTTDLALLKIEAENLPFMRYGNSDNVQIGEWVLAVGNPFDLTSTVTAGIVSAKGRSINILRRADGLGVESFIQTDAAVNPGNSGGALVNLKGELIGINTAIATQTGSYSGYSFAVPSSIVSKVIDDLKNYGEVQRALLGISIKDLTPDLAAKLQLSEVQGVYVEGLTPDGAAKAAGIKAGDLILKIDGQRVNSVPELQETVARHRPGDEVSVSIWRDGQTRELSVKLKNKQGSTEIIQRLEESSNYIGSLGAEIRNLTESEQDKYRTGGLMITRLADGSKLKEAGIPIGFVITHVEKQKVDNLEEFKSVLDGRSGGILIEGLSQDRRRMFYAIGL
ncbi:MAG: Do family serine endopeptidase [Cytophagales bacterium]|nr:MAG: Do family serine endopeptidase [Cytophagales bacterium]TAF60525.1 MAG: Do family serine endopeptidase [Cytophagales bacterium]